MNGFIIGVLIALVVIAFLIIVFFLSAILTALANIQNTLRRMNP